jgi:hypothetical protein
MLFRTERRRFSRMELRAQAARPRCARRLTLVVESAEVRASMSGLVVNPGVICGFNPQPDPRARLALVGLVGSATNGSQTGAAPVGTAHQTDVPPGPC